MRVGLITYQTGHRKTVEVTLKLITRGHEVIWYAFPFVKRAPKHNAYYAERPPQLLDYDVEDFCRREGVIYLKMPGWQDEFALFFKGADVYLHCTAKIVPKSFIEGRMILNAHPGILPENRGVDAFKWSIIKGWPIGVTLHIIDEEIDRGVILYRRPVPVLENDTLATVAERAYAFECDMLANFDAHLSARRLEVGDYFPVSHARIPLELDAKIESLFLAHRDAALRPQLAAIA